MSSESLRASGGRAVAIQADVSKLADGQRFISETVSQLGELDILVNNAGVEKRADFWDVTEADYDFVLERKFEGLVFRDASDGSLPDAGQAPGKNHQYQLRSRRPSLPPFFFLLRQ